MEVHTFDDQRIPQEGWFIVHLCAFNDENGNPRRCYVLYTAEGNVADVWDEGYGGVWSVPEPYRKFAHLAPKIDVTPRQYLEMTTVLYDED